MLEQGLKNPTADLQAIGLRGLKTAYWNLTPSELIEHTIKLEQGVLSDTGALVVRTGKFTGRSPKDRFIVADALTEEAVDWGGINIKFDADKYDALYNKVVAFFEGKDAYVSDLSACAADNYSLKVRVVTEFPWSNMFAQNMFIRPSHEEILAALPEWTVICAPSFIADPATDGTRQGNFAVLNFTKKQIIIGGTAYTGEIKKGIFSALNFILPHLRDVFTMHCSANVGKDGDTAIFFGLSGTGKTTLSADPNRYLVGDDEHGWSDEGVFNFEGGCYAKTVDLTEEKEPEIFGAIKHGAILENIIFEKGTRKPDYADCSITENTRVSYPIHHIANALPKSVAGHPKNIFFLAYDAFGVLPPIAKLTPGQAMYYFISGYTAKVAGTEQGILEPQPSFAPGFGEAFLPLHPMVYAQMLGNKMQEHEANVWLVNTGLTGGVYGEGTRFKLSYTRALITAALTGNLEKVTYDTLPIFDLAIPTSCEGVPSELLNPRLTWSDKVAYDKKAVQLAKAFNDNFQRYDANPSEIISAAAPKIPTTV